MKNIRRDFFTQKQLLSDWNPPKDWFEHDKLATIFHQRASQLAPGSVIAIQGGWGTGKTDLLARIFIEERNRRLDEFAGKEKDAEKYYPIWINPWRQSVPDVISPIASILVNRLKLGKGEREKALNTMVSAGFAFLQKAGGAALMASGNPIIGGAIMGLPSLMGTYKKSNSDTLEWNDPMIKLGEAFSDLVGHSISSEEAEYGNRLLICIDDLDRCAPGAQVQIIESIIFLASAGAPVTIYAGLDPAIVRTSIENRYHVNAFDAEQYLAKIFSTRFNLPERNGTELERALQGIMKEEFPTSAGTDSLHDIIRTRMNLSPDWFIDAGVRIFHDSKLGRARLMRKVMNDLFLFASSGTQLHLRDFEHVLTFFTWLTICNQYPLERQNLLADRSAIPEVATFIYRVHEGSKIYETGPLWDPHLEIVEEQFIRDVKTLDPYLQIAGI